MVVRRQALQGLNGHGLCRNLIVVPAIACTWGVVVAAHILTIDGPLLQRLGILEGSLRIGCREDYSREGFLVDALGLDVFLEQFHQILVGILHIVREFTSVEGTEVEPLKGLEAGEHGFDAVFLSPLLDLLHLFHDLLSHETESLREHVVGLALNSCHRIEAYKHLTDGNSHIERAWHLWPPRPRTIVALQA